MRASAAGTAAAGSVSGAAVSHVATAACCSSVVHGVCKYFVNSGSCSAGAACRFLHPDAAVHLDMKARWVAEKVTRRCMRPTTPADSADPHGKVPTLPLCVFTA
jgi:hypothetical protein